MRIREKGRVGRMRVEEKYQQDFGEESEGKSLLERSRRRWDNNNNNNNNRLLNKCDASTCVDLIYIAQDRGTKFHKMRRMPR
jgi:hypothetical protein